MKLRVTPQNDTQAFYGHGKLLITGEYFVLDGAKALSVPTKFGQSLRVKYLSSSESILYWVALNNKNKAWLNLTFDTSDFTCLNSKTEEAQRLSKILQITRQLNRDFLIDGKDAAVETHLEFPNEWGLGSSSTLIYCLSKWAKVDGYELLKLTIGGSGYDVASAGANSAILYQIESGKPKITPMKWEPPFTDQLFFAYTGNKQLSSEGIKNYRAKPTDRSNAIIELNRITEEILATKELKEFELLLKEHEVIVGDYIKQMKIGDTVFGDYWGAVKSLGAWGGDYVLMTNDRSETELTEYLRQKNISIVFNWKDIILNGLS